MNTYEFMVTVAGSDFKAYTQSNNPAAPLRNAEGYIRRRVKYI